MVYKKACSCLIVFSMVFALIALCANGAFAAEYVFESPSLVDDGGLRFTGTAWVKGESSPRFLTELGSINLYAGMTNDEDDYSHINNVPLDGFRLVQSGGWLGTDLYREFIKPTVNLADLANTDRFRFYWEYKFPKESVYVLHLKYDNIPVFVNGVFKVSFYWTSYINRTNTDLLNLLQNNFGYSTSKVGLLKLNSNGSGVSDGEDWYLPPSAVTEEILSNRSTRYTCYFDISEEGINQDLVASLGDYNSMSLVLNIPFMVPYSSAYSYGSYTGNAVFPKVYEIISNDKMQEEVNAISNKMDNIEASVDGVKSSVDSAIQMMEYNRIVISGEIQDTKEDIIRNQNENTNKIIQGQKDAIKEGQDREENEVKQEASENQEEGVEEAQKVFGIGEYTSAMNSLVSGITYNGYDFSFAFPAAKNVPFVGDLWDSQQIPIKFWIDSLPDAIRSIVRFLGWFGLALAGIHEVERCIDILNGHTGKGGES